MRLKVAVMVLVLLAAGKVAAQDYLYRTGTRDTLVSIYRDRAIAACQKEPHSQGLVASATVWTKPAEIRLVIGKSDLDVWFWQIDNAMWNARYRNPYLHLATADRFSTLSCEYDIVHGVATVYQG